MKITLISFLILASSFIWLPTHAQILDQSQLNYNAGTSARTLPGYSIFQSFTAGLTGTMVEIRMGVFNYINGSGTLVIYAGGDTTGAVLQTTNVNVFCGSGNCMAAFSVMVNITAGQVYTFRFIPGAGMPDPYGVQMENPGTYPGGEFGLPDPSGVYYPGFDMVFQTYVSFEVGVDEDINSNVPFEIRPNPMGPFSLLLLRENPGDATVGIYDLHGHKVKSYEHFSGDHLFIDRAGLSAGIYCIRLLRGGEIVAVEKLMITD